MITENTSKNVTEGSELGTKPRVEDFWARSSSSLSISLSIEGKAEDIGITERNTKKSTKDMIETWSFQGRWQPYSDIILKDQNGAKQFY